MSNLNSHQRLQGHYLGPQKGGPRGNPHLHDDIMMLTLRNSPARGFVGTVTDCGVRGLGFKSPSSILTSRTETSSLSRVVRDGGDPFSVPLSGQKIVSHGGVFDLAVEQPQLFRKLYILKLKLKTIYCTPTAAASTAYTALIQHQYCIYCIYFTPTQPLLRTDCTTTSPPLHPDYTTTALRQHHHCIQTAPPLHHRFTTAAPKMYYHCFSNVSQVHNSVTTNAPVLHHHYTPA